MINPALSPLCWEFHQKDMEKGILIAVLSTFPETLTFPLPPNNAFFPFAFSGKKKGGSPWNQAGLPSHACAPAHTRTHTERELVSDGG